MLLLLPQDLADVFPNGVLFEPFTLSHTLAIVANRVVLVVEIGAQQVPWLVRALDR